MSYFHIHFKSFQEQKERERAREREKEKERKILVYIFVRETQIFIDKHKARCWLLLYGTKIACQIAGVNTKNYSATHVATYCRDIVRVLLSELKVKLKIFEACNC